MKVKPLIYQLTESALKSVTTNSEAAPVKFEEDLKQNISRRSFVVIKEAPTPSMEYMVAIVQKDKLYAGAVPLPSSLFYEQAKEFARQVIALENQFPENISMKMASEDVEINVVHETLYSTFLIYKISAITSIITFVECLTNAIIPEGFTTLNSKGNITNKGEIERFWTLTDKLKKIIPEICDLPDRSKFDRYYNKFMKIYLLRNEFIHLKTSRSTGKGDPFIDHFSDIVNLDLQETIADIEELVRLIEPNYFE